MVLPRGARPADPGRHSAARRLVGQAVLEIVHAQHRHQRYFDHRAAVGRRSLDHLRHAATTPRLALTYRRAAPGSSTRGTCRIRGVEDTDTVVARGQSRWSSETSSGASQGRRCADRRAHVGVADDADRGRAVAAFGVPVSSPFCSKARRAQVQGHLLVVELVDQDVEQSLPGACCRLVVRTPSVRRVRTPRLSAGLSRMSDQGSRRSKPSRRLAEISGRTSTAATSFPTRLEPGHRRVDLDRRSAAFARPGPLKRADLHVSS